MQFLLLTENNSLVLVFCWAITDDYTFKQNSCNKVMFMRPVYIYFSWLQKLKLISKIKLGLRYNFIEAKDQNRVDFST
jgi:hypothetical protein